MNQSGGISPLNNGYMSHAPGTRGRRVRLGKPRRTRDSPGAAIDACSML
jgi:hypothetical protein